MPSSPKAPRLPLDVPDYSAGAANRVLNSRFHFDPTHNEQLMGILMEAGPISVDDLQAALLDRCGPKHSHLASKHVLRFRRLVDRVQPGLVVEPSPGILSLDRELLPSPGPKFTQDVVRVAAIRWLARTNQRGRFLLIHIIREVLGLNEDEEDVLNELLQRQDYPFSPNAKNHPELTKRRKQALRSLAAKLEEHFGEPGIDINTRAHRFTAMPRLLAEIPGLSLQQIQDAHQTEFGPNNLPIKLNLAPIIYPSLNLSSKQRTNDQRSTRRSEDRRALQTAI